MKRGTWWWAIGTLVLAQGALAQVGETADAVDMVDYDDTTAAGAVHAEDAAEATVAGDAVQPPAQLETGGAADVAAASASGDAAHPQAADAAKRLPPWAFGGERHGSSWWGTAGLMDVKEAGSSDRGTFALGLFGGFFKYSDYLVVGDENTQSSAALNVRVVPLPFLEVHAGAYALSNYNTEEYPHLFQTIGDVDLGVKGFYAFNDLVSVGLDATVAFLNSVGTVGVDWSGTSVFLDALATFNLRALHPRVPVRALLMAGYAFDNSANLVSDLEADHGGCGQDEDGDGRVSYTGCLSPVERTALRINRSDQVRVGVGLDAALPYVSPMVEYRMDIPVNRQGFTCPIIPGSYDKCTADDMASALRQWLNLGVRVLPPIPDLALEAGVEIGLSGYAPTVHELAAQEPYVVKFGLSYQFAPFARKETAVQVVEKVVEVEKPVQTAPQPEPQVGVIAGMVHEAGAPDKPVGGAVVRYVGKGVNPQVTTSTGRFNSYELSLGAVELEIEAEGYEPGHFTVQLTAPGVLTQKFALTAKPQKGSVRLVVSDVDGKPVAGLSLTASGAVSGTWMTDANGVVEVEADAGDVVFFVADGRYLVRQKRVSVTGGGRVEAEMTVRPTPKRSLVVVKKDRIRIMKKVHFKTNSDEIAPASFALLDEVADTILKNPQIKKIEIQGHTDDRGTRKHNLELSQKRADAVRAYLIESGVEPDRLVAKGYGPDVPVAPNITRAGRAKNRRVEFHILESE